MIKIEISEEGLWLFFGTFMVFIILLVMILTHK